MVGDPRAELQAEEETRATAATSSRCGFLLVAVPMVDVRVEVGIGGEGPQLSLGTAQLEAEKDLGREKGVGWGRWTLPESVSQGRPGRQPLGGPPLGPGGLSHSLSGCGGGRGGGGG